jgi:hypothetical protein
MKRTTKIGIDYHADVEQALERFGDHEDMNEPRIVRWLAQFPDEELPLAAQVIRYVKYYNARNLRSMTKQLFEIAVDEFRAKGYKRSAFVAVGDPGSGSGVVARVLKELVRGRHQQRVLSMVDITQLKPTDVEAIVFIDDFSGTGQTLETWWENVEPLVRPSNATVFVGLLVLNEPARPRIERFANVLAVDELDSSRNVFANENREFSGAAKAKLLERCGQTGCAGEYVRGFGQCGLLLAFKHGCPNNVSVR